MKITIGTTPIIRLTVKDFEVKDDDQIHLYFSQKGKMKFKKITPEVIYEDGKIITTLTQEDTFKLNAKAGEVKMRFRLITKDGIVRASGEAFAEIDDVEDENEVIEWIQQ